MKTILGDHFDLLVVAGIAVLLVVLYTFIYATKGVSDESLKTEMIFAVGGAIGLARGQQKQTNASTETGNVVVKQDGQQ